MNEVAKASATGLEPATVGAENQSDIHFATRPQYLCINNSALDITFQGATYLLSSILPVLNALSMPVQPTLKTLACHCTYPLMELSISSLSTLLNDNLTH
eukprot:598697-Pelagomonas_calceolata.AAC.1